MTEREAWLLLAREFSKPRGGRADWSEYGLCTATLNQFSGIDVRDAIRCKAKQAALQRTGTVYLAPYTNAGDKVRVRFCRRMAAQLKRKARRRKG